MCAPKEEITNNELPPILNAVQTPPAQEERRTWEPVCVVCEFAMEVCRIAIVQNFLAPIEKISFHHFMPWRSSRRRC